MFRKTYSIYVSVALAVITGQLVSAQTPRLNKVGTNAKTTVASKTSGKFNSDYIGSGAIIPSSTRVTINDDGVLPSASDVSHAGCDTCGTKKCCCTTKAACKWGAFGELLYLRPRNAEVVYGVPIDGPIVPPPADPIQTGPVGMIDPTENTGYRAGFYLHCGPCDTVSATYTSYDSNRSDGITTNPGEVVRPMTIHPSTLSANTDGLFSNARQDIEFDTIDADLRHVFSSSSCHTLKWLLGIRYTTFEQRFANIFGDNGVETVATDIDFEGIGARIGLEGEYELSCRSLYVYSKAHSSFLGGRFTADYDHGSNFNASIADTAWETGRLVTQLDFELGVGWHNKCDTFRMSFGYLVSGWFNVVKTDDWIDAVQANDFSNLGSTMTFDGLVARVEFRR
jgi:hypothetical protein